MSKNIRFSGGDQLEGLEKKVHEVFMVTELNNGKDAYMLSYGENKEVGTDEDGANKGGNSGLSFGGNQMDLAHGEASYRVLFIDIMKQSTDKDNNKIISAENLEIIEKEYLTKGKTPSTVFGDLLPKINNALASKYGMKKINEMYVLQVKENIQHVNKAIDLLTHENNKKILKSDEWIMRLADFHNKFVIALPKKGEPFKENTILKYLNGEEAVLKNYRRDVNGNIMKDQNKDKVVNVYQKIKLEGDITPDEFEKFIKSTDDYNKSKGAKKGIDLRLEKIYKVLLKYEIIDAMKKIGFGDENVEKLFDNYSDYGQEMLLNVGEGCLKNYYSYKGDVFEIKGHLLANNNEIELMKKKMMETAAEFLKTQPDYLTKYKAEIAEAHKAMIKNLHVAPQVQLPPIYQINTDIFNSELREEVKQRLIKCFDDGITKVRPYFFVENSYYANHNNQFETYEYEHQEL